METFKDHPQLGRFTLRDEGTISTESLLMNKSLSFIIQEQQLQ